MQAQYRYLNTFILILPSAKYHIYLKKNLQQTWGTANCTGNYHLTVSLSIFSFFSLILLIISIYILWCSHMSSKSLICVRFASTNVKHIALLYRNKLMYWPLLLISYIVTNFCLHSGRYAPIFQFFCWDGVHKVFLEELLDNNSLESFTLMNPAKLTKWKQDLHRLWVLSSV